MNIARFKQKPLMAILRGIDQDTIEPLVETAIEAGLETLEITMNTPNASGVIRAAVRSAKGRLMIGAGTVLTTDDLTAALKAGATFIVMPTLVEDVVAYCVKNKIPSFPGALTPTEIYRAHQSGASMVKVFPARFFGPEYFREIKGPFNDIELLACSGVTLENISEYFSCGASAVAIGTSVFKKEWLAKKDFKSIGEYLGRYVKALL